MSICPSIADVTSLIQFLYKYGAPLSFDHIGILMNFEQLSNEVVSLVQKLPDDLTMEEPLIQHRTVSFDDPYMPDGFEEAGLADLFYNTVSWDIQEYITYFEASNCFDAGTDLAAIAAECFCGAEYIDSCGICNYYRINFALPGLATVIDDAYTDDLLWQALEQVADGQVSARLISYVCDLVNIPACIADLVEKHGPSQDVDGFIRAFSDRYSFLLYHYDYTDIDDALEDIAHALRGELEGIFQTLLILKSYLPQAATYYDKWNAAFVQVCKTFERNLRAMSADYESLEYWRDYFEMGDRYDILAKLFPDEYAFYTTDYP